MKKLQLFYLIIFSFTSFNSFSQIITETETKEEKSKTRKMNNFEVSDSNKTELLLTFYTSYNKRIITPNFYPFGKNPGLRENEKPIWTTNYSIGFRHYINTYFNFEGRLAFISTGEQYDYKSTESDSSYHYTQKYNYIGMPLSFNYYTGKKLKLLLGIGLTPQIFINSNKNTTWTTSENQSKEETIKTKQGYNTFNLCFTIQTGINYQLNEKWSFEILPTYRNQLLSTYLKTSNFRHWNSQLGIQYGLNFRL